MPFVVCRVRIDDSFTTLVMSIVVLEGLGRQLDPELDIFKVRPVTFLHLS